MINDQFVHNDENKFFKDHTNWVKMSRKWSKSMWSWKKVGVRDYKSWKYREGCSRVDFASLIDTVTVVNETIYHHWNAEEEEFIEVQKVAVV